MLAGLADESASSAPAETTCDHRPELVGIMHMALESLKGLCGHNLASMRISAQQDTLDGSKPTYS